MSTIRLRTWFLVLAMALLLAPAAHALEGSGAQAVVTKFLASQNTREASASAAQHLSHDLDGDGGPDIVLMWNLLGAIGSYPKLTIFPDQGRSYRALTADLSGMTEKLAVQGPMILIDTLMPGPGDARCCPTKKTQPRFRWAGGKLASLR